MNLITIKKIDKDETIYSWYVRNMQANGFDIKEMNQLEFNKDQIRQDLLLESSLKLFAKIYPNDNPDNHTLQSFYKIFYKNNNFHKECSRKETDKYCPLCFKSGDTRIKLYDQIPLKKVCTKHQIPLKRVKNLNQITTNMDEMIDNSEPVILEMDLEKELELSLMIEELYRERYNLNYMTLYGAVIEEYAHTLRPIAINDYIKQILDTIPEYKTFSNKPRESTLGLLNLIYDEHLQIHHEIFILILYLTFQTTENLMKAVNKVKSHVQYTECQYQLLLKYTLKRMKYWDKSQWVLTYNAENNCYKCEEEIIDENFRKEVLKKYRGEYTVIKEFNYHSVEYAEIVHNFCNTSSIYIKQNFLSSKRRCSICKSEITEEMIGENVSLASENQYEYISPNEIYSIANNNTGFLLDKSNNLYTISKSKLKDKQSIQPEYEIPKTMALYKEIMSIKRRI